MGVFKIDWALSEATPFQDIRCQHAATVHLGNSFEEIAQSESDTQHGRLNKKPYVLFAQQSMFDSSRAPDGKHTGWAYCHVPLGSEVDMTSAIENQVERFAPGFKDTVMARSAMNTAVMEAYNPNYIGGDISGGVMDLRQLFTRPTKSLTPYRTSDPKVYIASASTPPGGGVHEYREILHQAISHIYTAQTLIAKQVNSIANSAYWNLGKLLFEKQLEEGYGSGVVKQLSIDLKNKFPDMGLSPRNLWNMKRYYERYNQADTKLLQAVAVLPWGHNLLLLDKVQSLSAVAFYANEVATKGWSRDLLLNAIKMDSYSRADNHVKTNNFTNTLPGISAEYANEAIKIIWM
ncbi:UNVERIFIED_CONTAM: p49 [Trichonephila clavipes]